MSAPYRPGSASSFSEFDAEQAGVEKGAIDAELMMPSRHRTAWTKCHIIKRDRTVMMFTDAGDRFLMCAALVDNEFRISQDACFLEVRDICSRR